MSSSWAIVATAVAALLIAAIVGIQWRRASRTAPLRQRRDPGARVGIPTHRKVRAALFAVLLIAGGHTLTLTWQAGTTLERQRLETAATNLAGRQRMHSQRIGRFGSLLVSSAAQGQTGVQALADVVTQARADAERLRAYLQRDGRHDDIDHVVDAAVVDRWESSRHLLYRQAQTLLDGVQDGQAPTADDIAHLQQAVERAMADAEELVSAIETSLQARHAGDASRYQMWAAGTVALLVGLGLVVAEPTARSVKAQNLRMASQTRDVERLALVAKLTKNAVMITDERLRLVWVNGAFTRITGYSLEEGQGRTLTELLDCDAEQEPVPPPTQPPARRRLGARAQLRAHRKDGSELWLDFDIQPLDEAPQGDGGFVAVAADITERRRSQADLRVAAIAFNSLEAIAITDSKQVILRVNPAFTRITGYTADEACGQVVGRLLRSGRHEPAFYEAMWAQLHAHQHWQGEVWNRRRDGEIYPEWLSITAVADEEGQVANYVAVFTDITQKKLTEETIHNLAFYDPLTELPNRRLMRDRLEQLRASSGTEHQSAAVLFIDLDNFKELNDTRGHDVGDALLIEVARRLRVCVRAHDTVARQGGDEFVVILSNLTEVAAQAKRHAAVVAEKILASLSRPYDLGGAVWHCTASIGICLMQGRKESMEEILKRADIAMYEAKRAGRNAARFYDPATQEAMQRRIELEAELRSALSENQFSLNFQPQVDIDRRTVGAEVLLRWTHPGQGTISPAEFIPIAEDTDLILPIGEWVLREACRQLSRWSLDSHTQALQLAVNVSARQFRQPDFVEQVKRLIEESGANPRLLKLELTESVVLINIQDTLAKMRAIKAIGVRFAIDDFGTGQSSLAYLTKLSLDQLKIDQAFVADMLDSHTDGVIVQTMIGMAHSLGLDVIAEGVETEEQLAFLSANGCRYYQGYLLGRPVSIAQFNARLRDQAFHDVQ